jgi:hypothetical protein
VSRHPSVEPRGYATDDPLAALLGADEIAEPRAGFAEALRAELMARPAAGPAASPASPLPGRNLPWFLVTALAVVALVLLWRAGGPAEKPARTIDIAATPVQLVVPAARPSTPQPTVTVWAAAVPVPAERPAATRPVIAHRATALPTLPTIAPPTAAPPGAASERPKRSRSQPTSTEASDWSDWTPRPPRTATPTVPAATSTDAGYPALPATPTAAPTSVGLPTVPVVATPASAAAQDAP